MIAEQAVAILGVESCKVFLVSEDAILNLEASHPAHGPLRAEDLEALPAPAGAPLPLSGIFEDDLSLVLAEVDRLTEFSGSGIEAGGADQATAEQTVAVQYVPLVRREGAGEQLVGLLRLEGKRPVQEPALATGSPAEEDPGVASFADAVVAAIDTGRLLDELYRQRDYYQRLVDIAPTGIMTVNARGQIMDLNPQAAHILGCDRLELLGRPVTGLYRDPEEPRRIGDQMRRSDAGQVARHETTIRDGSGDLVPIRQSSAWLFPEVGQAGGSVGYFEDLRAHEESRRREALLLRASTIFGTAETLSDGLQGLVDMLVSLKLKAKTLCSVLLADEGAEGDDLVLVVKATSASASLDWRPTWDSRVRVRDWPSFQRMLEVGQIQVWKGGTPGERDDLRQLSELLSFSPAIDCALVVPLKIGPRVLGQLTLGDFSQSADGFSEEERELVAALAAQATALISRMQLLESTAQRERLLEALARASEHIRAGQGTAELLQEVVRLAATMMRCKVGGLAIHEQGKGRLAISNAHGLPKGLVGQTLEEGGGLIGSVALAGKGAYRNDYSEWKEADEVLKPCGLSALLAVPLVPLPGKVEAVLFVGDDTGTRQWKAMDLDILQRFGVQASIALQTAGILDRRQRMLDQRAFLHRISHHVQKTADLDRIVHIVLTGISARYGLGFNRAVALLLDDLEGTLVGRVGIGQLDSVEADKVWRRVSVTDFDKYIHGFELDEISLTATSVGARAADFKLPFHPGADDVFADAKRSRKPCRVGAGAKVPGAFLATFKIDSPFALVPMISKGQVLGFIAADNKFTGAAIGDEELQALMTFADTAAAAIDGAQLLGQILRGREQLMEFYRVSGELIARASGEVTASTRQSDLPRQIVVKIKGVAGASWVALVLINALETVEDVIAEPRELLAAFAPSQLIRPSGISMEVMRSGVSKSIPDIEQERDRVHPGMRDIGTRAAVCLPLSLPGRRIGVMWLHFRELRRFDEFEIASLQLYANQAAIAFETRRRFERLETMRTATEQLARATSKRDVQKQIACAAGTVLRANAALLWVYDSGRKTFLPEDSDQDGLDLASWQEISATGPGKEGTAYQVMDELRVVCENVTDAKQGHWLGPATRRLMEANRALGFQGLALRVGEERLGVIYALYHRPLIVDEEEAEAATSFADHAALALNKVRLHEQLQKALDAAKTVAQVSVLDQSATLARIAQSTKDVVGCDSVVLFEYDLRQQKIKHPPTMVGVRDQAAASRSEAELKKSIVYLVLDLDAPLVVEDMSGDPNFRDRRFAREEGIRSVVAIPLRATRDVKIGVMFVNYLSPRRFTEAELEHIKLFAAQAAVAIYNAQLFKLQSKQAQERDALIALSRDLLSTNSVKTTMDRAVAAVAKMLDTDFCDIVLLDRDGVLRVCAVVGWDPMILGLVVEPGTGSQTGYTIEAGEPVVVEDLESVKKFEVPPSVREHGLRSSLSVPMLQAGKIVGAMLVHSKALRRFTAEDAGPLSLAANDTAIAIRSAYDYEAGQRKSRLVEALYVVAKALTADLELDRRQILDQVVQPALNKITGGPDGKVSLATIHAYDDQSNEMVLESVFPPASYPQLVAGLGHRRSLDVARAAGGKVGISGLAVLTRRSHLVADVAKNVVYLEFDPLTRSELAVPLRDATRVFGVIDVESRELAAFDEDDRDALEGLAELVVVALKRLRQLEELKRTRQLVGARTAIAWLGMASSDWYHTVEGKVSAIREQVNFLRSETAGRKVKQRLGTIDQLAQQCIHRPDIAAPDHDMKIVPLNRLVREWTEELEKNKPELKKKIDIVFVPELHEDATVRANPLWLRRVLDLLLDNAGAALLRLRDQPAGEPPPSIRISCHGGGELAAVSIEDNGPGIDSAIHDLLFFFPIPSWKAKGLGIARLGIGLMIAQAIAEAYGGYMAHRHLPTNGCGTRMTLYLRLESEARTGG